jgi:HK97 family phage major capsid protein
MATIAERITELREERARIDQEQRQLLDTAADERRGLTGEESEKDDRLDTRFREVTVELRRFERQQDRDAELRDTPPAAVLDPISGGGAREERNRTAILASDEYRSAMVHYLRYGFGGDTPMPAELRSVLQAGVDADGGVTVAETWRRQLIETMREFSSIRTHAEVVTTETGGDFHLPRVSTDAAAVTIVAEGTDIPDDAEGFDEVVMKAWPYKRLTKANEEAVQDHGFDVGGFVTRRLGEDIALASGAHYVVGTGASQPTGLMSRAVVGVTTAAPTAIVYDELVDLLHSVKRPYRFGARWLAGDLTIASLRKIKDANDNPIWQPGMQAGEPDLLLGYPIDDEPFADLIAATRIPLGFGNIFRAYAIRDVGTMAIRFLGERFADRGQVAWRGWFRTDGNIKDVNAFKTLRMHA